MIIEIGNIYSKVVKCTPEEFMGFRQVLTVPVPNHWFSKAFRAGKWDGMKRYFRGKSFCTGLLFLLEDCPDIPEIITRERKLSVDYSVSPTMLNTKKFTGKYAYQLGVVKKCLKDRRGIVHVATGGGKTLMAAAVVKALDLPTLFVVHQKDLMYQTYSVFEKEIGGPIGLLGDGEENIEKITIGMPKTIVNRMKRKEFKNWLQKEVQVVFADECHLASSKTWVKVLQNTHNAPFRFGLSGTPLDRGIIDNLTLMAYTGRVIARVSNEDLIALQVNSRPVIHMISSVSETNDIEYHEAYDKYIVENEERNSKICRLVKKHIDDGITAVMVKKIEHGKILEQMLKEENIPVVFCYGETSTEKRLEEFEAMRKGKRKVIILSRIGEASIDIPNLSVMIRASGGKSTISTLQTIGRELRNPTDSENEVIYYDFVDTGNCHLEKHSEARRKDYERENFEIVDTSI